MNRWSKTDFVMSNGKVYGFFHPYCNAGGGGERVLWQAVQATLDNHKENKVVIYTGDNDATIETILSNVIKRFDIKFDNDRVEFIFLTKRHLVDPQNWPFLTLLGQAFGSIILAFEAARAYKPDIWVETMGYPFTYPLVHYMLGVPIIAYVHYPVISKDMLGKLNVSFTSINGIKQLLKFIYWYIFMLIYTFVGSYVDITLTNSTWTYNHIKSIWWYNENISIVYPPCSTEKFIEPNQSKWTRENIIVSIAQFRPEKRHDLIIEQYAKFLETTNLEIAPKLVLIGSIRSKADEENVELLKQKASKLKIPSNKIQFILDAKYEVIKEYLQKSSFGLNAMWNEHFGIAVVEYSASGLIPIVHASAGPLLDIVVPWDSTLKQQSKESKIDNRTGFFFKSETDPDYASFKDQNIYPSLAECFVQANSLTDDEKLAISSRGKECVLEKFSDETFNKDWIKKSIEPMQNYKQKSTILRNSCFVALIVRALVYILYRK